MDIKQTDDEYDRMTDSSYSKLADDDFSDAMSTTSTSTTIRFSDNHKRPIKTEKKSSKKSKTSHLLDEIKKTDDLINKPSSDTADYNFLFLPIAYSFYQ